MPACAQFWDATCFGIKKIKLSDCRHYEDKVAWAMKNFFKNTWKIDSQLVTFASAFEKSTKIVD